MAGRGRGRGRGRGTSVFINKDVKDLLNIQGSGRADEIPPPLYDVRLILHLTYSSLSCFFELLTLIDGGTMDAHSGVGVQTLRTQDISALVLK